MVMRGERLTTFFRGLLWSCADPVVYAALSRTCRSASRASQELMALKKHDFSRAVSIFDGSTYHVLPNGCAHGRVTKAYTMFACAATTVYDTGTVVHVDYRPPSHELWLDVELHIIGERTLLCGRLKIDVRRTRVTFRPKGRQFTGVRASRCHLCNRFHVFSTIHTHDGGFLYLMYKSCYSARYYWIKYDSNDSEPWATASLTRREAIIVSVVQYARRLKFHGAKSPTAGRRTDARTEISSKSD